MSETLIYTIIVLSIIGGLAAIILFFVAKKFYVQEDPRIDEVEEALPSANCGACGYAGCRAFAEACVSKSELSEMFCPVGGNAVMGGVASILGLEVKEQAPRVAVVRCNGTCESRPKTNQYDGATSCAIAAQLYAGDTGCSYGCLGCGDCADSCEFDALHMNPKTGLPEVDEDKCVSCNACVKACPKDLIELRKKMPKGRKVYVSCRNYDKGAVARKSCKTACIACTKCFKECPFDAITMEKTLAYIDSDKCKLCRKCVAVCPTGAIIEENFPPRKAKPTVEKKAAPKATEAKPATEKKAAPSEKESKPAKDNGEQQ